MKILIVSGEYYEEKSGGIGKHVKDLHIQLSEAGHKVKVIVSTDTKIPDSIFLKCSNIPIYRLFDWSFKVSSYLKKQNYDIVHVHMPTGMLYPFFHDPRIPMVVTFHSTGAVIGNPVLKFLEIKKDILCAKKADKIIAVSRVVQKTLIANGIDNSKIEYIPNWIAQKKYITKRKEGTLKLLYVGRLEKIKGIDNFIDALKHLKINYQATIIGKGSLKDELIKKAEGSNIIFKGYIDNDKLEPFFRKADIFVLPSLSESMPYSLLEAMSYGLPIVASDIDSIRQIANEKFVVFAKPKSPKDFSDAILKASKNIESMSLESFNESKKYSQNIKKLISIYDEVKNV